MFNRDPEMRHAYILVHQLLRGGKMTAELGELFLGAELSGVTCDTIFQDMENIADEEPGEWEWP